MENYKPIKVVGRGAFGTVYLATRLSDDKEVILKQIPVEQMSAVDRQGVLVEAKVLAMLQHPNIIEYYENFLEDKAMVIVMEYAAGGTLYDMLDARASQGEPLTEDEVGHLFAQIVLPMYYVHQNQILHRDLKSQNIFLTRALDHVKIGDFGISKILSSKSKAFTVVGTPCYISPELCEGKAYNTKSDVWALGCILYELCMCKRAFEAPTLPALIIKIMRGTTVPISNTFSMGLKQLLAAMLAVDPSKRASIPEMMAHHWLAPYIYRLHTTVGHIPCVSKPERPMSVTRPQNLDLPEHLHTKMGTKKESASPYRPKVPETVAYFLREGYPPVLIHPLDKRTDITCISMSATHIVAVESSGQVVLWRDDVIYKDYSEGEKLFAHPRRLHGISGINIVQVATGRGFICVRTDRGILFTKGSGSEGCLGHGDTKDVDSLQIVEALLGDDIVSLSAGETHVAVVTNDYEAFTWGTLGGKMKTLPEYIDAEYEIERAVCGVECTALLSKDGRLLVCGENTNNRLYLDTRRKQVAAAESFRLVAADQLMETSGGEIVDVALGRQRSLVLTAGGDIWTTDGEDRSLVRIELGKGSKSKTVALSSPFSVVGVAESLDLAATADGSVYCWAPGDWKHARPLDFPWTTKPNIKRVALSLFESSGVAIFTLDK